MAKEPETNIAAVLKMMMEMRADDKKAEQLRADERERIEQQRADERDRAEQQRADERDRAEQVRREEDLRRKERIMQH